MTERASPTEIPLEKSLADLGRRLGVVAILIAAITVVGGIFAGRPAAEMFFTGVSLAVAVVPEGLPTVVTVTLALGIRSMSRRNALLRNLQAAETLGAASVICTDKTGTLTQNRMTIRRLWTSDGIIEVTAAGVADPTEQLEHLLETAQRCNHASLAIFDDEVRAVGDPTESALLTLAHLYGRSIPHVEPVREIPFSSTSKMMTAVIETDDSLTAHVKGAPEVILDRCVALRTGQGVVELNSDRRREFESAIDEMTSAGLRTLALAERSVELIDGVLDQGLTLIGAVGMHDPPRPEVPAAVGAALAAGLNIVVMTGDAGGTAISIATEVGLPVTEVLTGAELDTMSDLDLLDELDGTRVLARVTPEHKMRVVRLLQDHGEVVAMTGDGVNDAPALQQASIGVAMGLRGTDVARGAADLVLADDNFASIVAAIEEGRRQYANIRKFIRYLLSSNLGEVIAISGAVAIGWPLILIPAQILWMNLLTDGVTALALGVEPVEPDAMTRPPRRVEDSIVDRTGLWWIVGGGAMIGLITLVVFRATLGTGEGSDLLRAQTMAFTTMVLLETVNVLNFRSERQSLRVVGLLRNRWLVIAWVAAIATQVAAVHLPGLSTALGTTGLSAMQWLVAGLVSVPILGAGELVKWRIRRTTRERSPSQR